MVSKILIQVAVLAAIPLMAFADMDPASRNLLIDKLGKVQLTLAPQDSSRVSVTLRLADLLSERARIASMKEIESGCTVCKAGDADRDKAIRFYKEVFDRVPMANRGKVMIQLGHLYEMTGKQKEARQFYEKTASESVDPNAKAEAQLSLAEMLFKQNQFADARKSYREVLSVPTAQSRGLAAYRAAWCSFNLGQIETASTELQAVLSTPELMTRAGVASGQSDVQFQEEVSRDLATFLSKLSVQAVDVEKLYKLSPESTKLSNVTLLAAEAERVGRKKEALLVWNFVYEHQKKPADRLEVHLHRAPLYIEINDKTAGLTEMESAAALWKDLKGCGKADCAEMKKVWKQTIVVWNQAEKKAPTAELLAGYGHYLATFSDDAEMNLWASQVAKDLKNYPQALKLQQQAFAAMKEQKAPAEKMDSALLTSIEIAEASGQDELLKQAQDQYLVETKLKTKVYEVKYQQARRLYDQGKHAEASVAMKALALDTKGPQNLRGQAADLALDSLGILKDEENLQTWSSEFSKVFPGQASSFHQVGQKAILSRSATLAATSSAAAFAALEKFDVSKATKEDRVVYLKNKLILAEKTGNLKVARSAAEELIALKDIKPEDREFALGRKAWIAEMQLDFASAYSATSQMALKDQSPEHKALKMAIYADLSGQNPVPLYQQYLKSTQDEGAKQAVASEIVRRSADPAKEIEVQKPILEKAPDLLARLYSEAYSKKPSESLLKKASSEAKIQKTNWGRLLSRVALLKEFQIQQARLTKMQIDSKNQRTLAKSIKDRAAELAKVEKMAAGAIEAGDWTSQLVTIDLVAKESSRFYQDLMGLPMPEGLKPEEEQEYMRILSEQASPFKVKADQAASKVAEFWAAPNWKSELEKSVQDGFEVRSLIADEIAALKTAARSEDQEFFKKLESENSQTSTLAARPDLKQIEAARDLVRANPLDRTAAEKLLELEKKSKNFAMVQYLEGRLRSLSETKAEAVQ